jgi:hypothetical protein
MTRDPRKLNDGFSQAEIDAFVRMATANTAPARGRVIFAMDATASRQFAWKQARRIQAEMFKEAAALGGLDLQLCYFRGHCEFSAGPWLSDPAQTLKGISKVKCASGKTQLEGVLRHAAHESAAGRVGALVFIGDAMEERLETIKLAAAELGGRETPAFMFQEGQNPAARRAFEQIARITGGAWYPFDAGSAGQMRELLTAATVYAVGGRRALESFGDRTGGAALGLARQLRLGHDKR